MGSTGSVGSAGGSVISQAVSHTSGVWDVASLDGSLQGEQCSESVVFLVSSGWLFCSSGRWGDSCTLTVLNVLLLRTLPACLTPSNRVGFLWAVSDALAVLTVWRWKFATGDVVLTDVCAANLDNCDVGSKTPIIVGGMTCRWPSRVGRRQTLVLPVLTSTLDGSPGVSRCAASSSASSVPEPSTFVAAGWTMREDRGCGSHGCRRACLGGVEGSSTLS